MGRTAAYLLDRLLHGVVYRKGCTVHGLTLCSRFDTAQAG